jgi:hypothetical protein
VTVFQWITLPVLGLLLLKDTYALLFRHPSFRRDRLVRVAVWAAAFAAIAVPELTSQVANAIGIQRGADLVLYLFVLAFLGTAFYFYSQNVRLQRQLTDVVRHIAIQEARKEAPAAPRPDCP